jgi:hypothetical protein
MVFSNCASTGGGSLSFHCSSDRDAQVFQHKDPSCESFPIATIVTSVSVCTEVPGLDQSVVVDCEAVGPSLPASSVASTGSRSTTGSRDPSVSLSRSVTSAPSASPSATTVTSPPLQYVIGYSSSQTCNGYVSYSVKLCPRVDNTEWRPG